MSYFRQIISNVVSGFGPVQFCFAGRTICRSVISLLLVLSIGFGILGHVTLAAESDEIEEARKRLDEARQVLKELEEKENEAVSMAQEYAKKEFPPGVGDKLVEGWKTFLTYSMKGLVVAQILSGPVGAILGVKSLLVGWFLEEVKISDEDVNILEDQRKRLDKIKIDLATLEVDIKNYEVGIKEAENCMEGLEEFVSKAKAQMQEAGVIVEVMELERLLKLAGTKAKDMETLCNQARKKVSEAGLKSEKLEKDVAEITKKKEDIKKRLAEMDKNYEDAKIHADNSTEAGEEVVEAKQSVEVLKARICQDTDTIKNSDNADEINRLLRKIESDNEEIDKYSGKALKSFWKAVKEAQKAERIFDGVKSLPDELESLNKALGDLLTSSLNETQGILREAENTASQDEEIVSELGKIKSEASGLGNQARNKIAAIEDEEKVRELTDRVVKALDGINAVVDGIDKKCPEEIKVAVESAEKKLSGVKSAIKDSIDEMNSLTKPINAKKKVDEIKEFSKDARASADTAEVFFSWVETFVADAATCVREAKGVTPGNTGEEKLAEMSNAIEGQIGTLSSLKDQLIEACAAVEGEWQAAKAAADNTERLLNQINSIAERVSKAVVSCNDALTIQSEITQFASEAESKEKMVNSSLDQASSIAESCDSKEDSAAIMRLYNNAKSLTSEVIVSAAAAKGTNNRLKSILNQAQSARQETGKVESIAGSLDSEVNAASAAAKGAQAYADTADSLANDITARRNNILTQIEGIPAAFPPDFKEAQHAVSRLRGLLSTATALPPCEAGKYRNNAQNEAERAGSNNSSAKAHVSTIRGVNLCDGIVPADDAVSRADSAQSGAMISFMGSSGLPMMVTKCAEKEEEEEEEPDISKVLGGIDKVVVNRQDREPPKTPFVPPVPQDGDSSDRGDILDKINKYDKEREDKIDKIKQKIKEKGDREKEKEEETPPAPTTPTPTTTPQVPAPTPKSGLSDVTVSVSPTKMTVWDHGTEDFDRVSISLNGQVVNANVTLRKSKQVLTLYLVQGNNTLSIKALDEGDPAINKRLNLPRGNAAAVEIEGVTIGKRSQSWVLMTGQTGTMQITYQP